MAKESMKKNDLFMECICGNNHYLSIDTWEATGTVISLVDHPVSLWGALKGWWQHRHFYICDLILDEEKLRTLIAKLVTVQRRLYPPKVKE